MHLYKLAFKFQSMVGDVIRYADSWKSR